ncbi:MAG: serine/threonine-protein kinase [Polyangiaceae bacterium]
MMSQEYVDPNADPPLPPGTAAGEYVIESILGQGGFGAVYRAIHPVIGKAAAVKVLKREFSANVEIVSRFVSEARAVNQIRHKNIVDIFNFGVLPDGRQFFVMELLEGMALDKLIGRHGRFSPSQALPILKQVARALGAAHAQGIAHRDIKPENVMVTFDEDGAPTCKLLDFGIAKLTQGDTNRHKTRTGTPMGTPMYMSPEQVHGRSIDYRTDIYSFGIMVFEMLVGACPFDGESAIDVMMKQANQPMARPTMIVPSLPPGVDAPVLAMVEKDPNRRPTSIVKAVDDFAAAVAAAGLPPAAPLGPLANTVVNDRDAISKQIAASVASGPTIYAPAQPVPSTSQAFTSSQMVPVEKKKSSILPILAILAIVGAGAGVGIFMITRNSSASGGSAASATSTGDAKAATSETAKAPDPGASTPIQVASQKPAPSAEEPDEGRHVKLTLKATPADAEVWFEGEKIGLANDEIDLPYDTEEVTLTLKKPGFQPLDIHVKPDHDTTQTVTLPSAARPPTGNSPPSWGWD